MNILIFTFGSRGDVQPYVALGAALRTQGHAVTVTTGQGFDEMITSHGLASAPASIDFREIIKSPVAQEALRTVSGKFKAMRAFKGLVRQQYEDMWGIAKDVRPDLIIYHPKATVAQHIAEALSVIAVPTTLQPMFVPTGDFPAPVLPFRDLGRFGNRLTHRFLNWVSAKGQGSLIGNWRQERLGLAPKDQRAFFEGYDPQGRMVPRLHGYSTQLVTKPHEWTEREHITGYWFLEPTKYWQPPEALAQFLQAGPPPVYVGFGSMPAKDAKKQTQIVVDALRKSAQRGVLATGWGGLGDVTQTKSIHVLDAAPHDWLFSRCAAVVHHGGAGTTHEGLRWGRPTIICPLSVDQPYWGRRVMEIGAGPKPLPQKHLNSEDLAAALQAAKDHSMISRAEEVGVAMRAEGGADEAAHVVERVVTHK